MSKRFSFLQMGGDCPQCVEPCRVELEHDTLTVWEKCETCGRAWRFTRKLSNRAQLRYIVLRDKLQPPAALDAGSGGDA